MRDPAKKNQRLIEVLVISLLTSIDPVQNFVPHTIVIRSLLGSFPVSSSYICVKFTVIPFHPNPIVQEQEESLTAVLCNGISVQHSVRIIGSKYSHVVEGVHESYGIALFGCCKKDVCLSPSKKSRMELIFMIFALGSTLDVRFKPYTIRSTITGQKVIYK